MTEKLYYKDSYMRRFAAKVLSCEECDGGYLITLDATAFFPEEGGQYSDRGTLGGARVLNVIERDGVIFHTVDSPLTVGTAVDGEIDFDERYEKMQCHTAEHILSGLIHSTYGLNNVGFHLGAEDVTMDISAPLSWDDLMNVERRANEIVFENIHVTAVYPEPDELPMIEYRSKLDITENVRIINIGEYDSCACCAPHVARTGELGLIKILDFERLRGGIRIHITAGRRAYRTVLSMYSNLTEISHMLSVPRLDSADAVEKLISDYEAKRAEYKATRLAYFEREGELLSSTDKNALLVFHDATQDELRAAANTAVSKVGGILVLLSGTDADYKYILASTSTDLRTEVKKINAALSGRGGGSTAMIQGSFAATLADIKAYFDISRE